MIPYRFTSDGARFGQRHHLSLVAGVGIALLTPVLLLTAEENGDDPEEENILEVDEAHDPIDSAEDNQIIRIGPGGVIEATNTPAVRTRGLESRVENEGNLRLEQSGTSPESRTATVLIDDGSFQNTGDGEIVSESNAPISLGNNETWHLSGVDIESWADDARNQGNILVIIRQEDGITITESGATLELTGVRLGTVPWEIPEEEEENGNGDGTGENGDDEPNGEAGENGGENDPPEEVPVPRNLRNSGTIAARVDGSLDVTGNDNTVRITGVHFEDHGELTNQDRIEAIFEGNIDSLEPGNTLEVIGVRGDGSIVITNSGTIRAHVTTTGESENTGSIIAAGVWSEGELDLTNRGTIEVIVGEAPGDEESENSDDATGANENGENEVLPPHVDAYGVYAGGEANVVNRGQILAQGGTAVHFETGGSLQNSGAIAGDVFLGDEDSTLILTPGYSFDGDVSPGAGNNTLELGRDPALQEFMGEYDGSFDGFSHLRVDAPDYVQQTIFGPQSHPTLWQLTGDHDYADGTDILAGYLNLNTDTFLSDVRIEEDGILIGTATITGNIDNRGILDSRYLDEEGVFASPEEGHGVLVVEGDVTFHPGSEFWVTAGETEMEAQRVTILTEGEDGALAVVDDTNLTPGMQAVTIITATEQNGLEGEFSDVVGAGARPFLLPVLDHDHAGGIITVTAEADIDTIRTQGQTRNQQAVAGTLADLAPRQGSNLEANYHDFLTDIDLASFNRFADGVSGEILASGAIAASAYGNTFRQTLLNTVVQGPGRTRPVRTSSGGWHDYEEIRLAGDLPSALDPKPEIERHHGIWARGVGGSGKLDSDHAGGDLDYGIGGILVGADTVVTENSRAGGAIGYARAQLDRNGDNIDTDVFQLLAYGSKQLGDFNIDGTIGYGFHDLESRRRVTGDSRTRGSYTGHELSASLQANTVRELDDLFVMPLAGLDYSHYNQGSFNESGPWALSVDSLTVNSLRAFAGLRLAMPYPSGRDNLIVPEMRFRYSHEILDDEASHSSRIRGDQSGNRFSATSTTMDRGIFHIGAGVMAQFSRWEQLSFFLDYDGNLGGSQNEHLFSGGFRFDF